MRIAAGVIRAARRFRQAGIGMDSELDAIDAQLGEGLGNELVSQCASFRVRPVSGCASNRATT